MNIGLVLGGGGARCFAHLGVIQALEERGYVPRALATCSTGSIIGALYAAVHSPSAILDLAKEVDFASFIHFDPQGSGLIDSERIADLLQKHAPETFGDLHIPLAVVATDVQTGEGLTFRSGPLALAACASNALPGVFAPVRHVGRDLMDGGVLNIVPVDVMREMTRQMEGVRVVAVDVSLSPTRKVNLEEESLWQKVTPPYSGGLPTALDVLMKAYAIREDKIRQSHYDKYPPDMSIRPDLPDDFTDKDFGRIEEAAEVGYTSAVKMLDERADS